MGDSQTKVTTSVPPETFVDALTDFGPDRNEIWGNSEAGYLKVHDRGDTWAEVTEGSGVAGGIWQRYRYDWGTPGRVRLDVLDSNAFGKGSWWEYRLTRQDDGQTSIELSVHRVPMTTKARLIDVGLSLFGRQYYSRGMRDALSRIEQKGTASGRVVNITSRPGPTCAVHKVTTS